MGFNTKSKNQIINDMLVEILTNVDEVTDANVGAILRNLVEALGIEISDLYDELSNVYDGTRILTSEGDDLENLGSLVGITRKQGTEAQGYVTFKRNNIASIDFTIPANAIVSTQPNTAQEQLRFLVNADTTFSAEIIGETHDYVNGLYDYAMNERYIDSVSSLTGIVSGGAYTFVENTDFEILKDYEDIIIEPDDVVVIDNCDVTTDWNGSTGSIAIATDSVDYKEGTASLKLGKSTTTNDTIYYEKVLGSVVDGSNLNGYLWFKVEDSTALNKINYIEITYGSGGDSTNSYTYQISQSSLSTGWKRYKIDFSSSTLDQLGIPNRSVFNYIKITVVTNNVTDMLTSGDLKMDWWIFSTSVDYIGDIISFLSAGTLPDDGTIFTTDYKPLSKEVLCIAEDVGDEYNVGVEKVFYKVSYIANIDSVNNYLEFTGGTDIELDDALRERIQYATELKGKATVEALRQALLGVEGVTSVSVDDMPLKTASAELHEHISFASTPTLALDYEVALDNVNLVVSGTRGTSPVTFINGTDYYLEDSTIHWISDLVDPDDSTNVLIDYDYRWLGHVEIYVAGTSTPLATQVVTDIDSAVYDTKAAGIDVQWYEPTAISIAVSAAILIDTTNGYLFADVKPNVEDAIRTFLNSKETGSDVYIAEIIDNIMNVNGVKNTTISAPGSDVVIATDEVGRAGTITITEI